MAEPRVVSLIASATEIVSALGMEHRLVGRSHECDYPAVQILSLPVCSSSKVDAAASSRDIDRQVREIVGEALSVYRVDGQLLDELAPTVIVTQTQCEVCAVSLRDVEDAVSRGGAFRAPDRSPGAHGARRRVRRHRGGGRGARDSGSGPGTGCGVAGAARRAPGQGLPGSQAAPGSPASSGSIRPCTRPTGFPNWWRSPAARVMAGEPGRHSGYFAFEELLCDGPGRHCRHAVRIRHPPHPGRDARSRRPARLERPHGGPSRGASSSPTATSTSTGPVRVSSSPRKSSPSFCIRTNSTSAIGVRAGRRGGLTRLTEPSRPVASGRSSGGLCPACRFARVVTSRRTRFTLCERSFTEARFPRYPRLPVLTCDGFVPLPSRDARSADSRR